MENVQMIPSHKYKCQIVTGYYDYMEICSPTNWERVLYLIFDNGTATVTAIVSPVGQCKNRVIWLPGSEK